jgi:hypothetical protein
VAVTDGALRIRDARPEDWPAVAALLDQLGRPSAAGADEPELRRVYVEFLAPTPARWWPRKTIGWWASATSSSFPA